MCINLPVRIVSIKDKKPKKKIIVEALDRKKEISGSLVRVKEGDYVFLRNNFIIGKINKKEAKQITRLITENI